MRKGNNIIMKSGFAKILISSLLCAVICVGAASFTREEAEEMAEMEIKAGTVKRYEQSDKPRKKATKERKVDETKSKEELTEHLESKAFETSIDSVLRSFKAQVPQTHSVIVRYIDINGNIIASKEYK